MQFREGIVYVFIVLNVHIVLHCLLSTSVQTSIEDDSAVQMVCIYVALNYTNWSTVFKCMTTPGV